MRKLLIANNNNYFFDTLQNLEGNALEIAIKCCQRQIQANKIASINSSNSSHMQSQVASVISVNKRSIDFLLSR